MLNNDEYELNLFDRIEVIKTANSKYNLLDNAYISFSGGKDSTVLSYLIDMALPGNKIPRVYINTGIEYLDIVKFVQEQRMKDERIIIVSPKKPIKPVLEKYGYPFKSKEHSKKVDQYWRTKKITNYLKMYIDPNNNGKYKTKYKCPGQLLYQFTEKNKLHISHLCCHKLKKEPAIQWQKENDKQIVITGMRSDEGGTRTHIGCIITDHKGNLKKYHPLLPVSDEFEDEFIARNKIDLCRLYYPPFNFKRTGCKGCPFALDLQEQLTIMQIYLPYERQQCETIWEPVYSEYRRLGYRLAKDEQLKLF